MWGGQRGGLQAWNHSAVAEEGSAVVRSRTAITAVPSGLTLCPWKLGSQGCFLMGPCNVSTPPLCKVVSYYLSTCPVKGVNSTKTDIAGF